MTGSYFLIHSPVQSHIHICAYAAFVHVDLSFKSCRLGCLHVYSGLVYTMMVKTCCYDGLGEELLSDFSHMSLCEYKIDSFMLLAQ